jgi:hypothetical protein
MKGSFMEVNIPKLCKSIDCLDDFVVSHTPSTSFSFSYTLIIPTSNAIMTDKLITSLNKPQMNYNEHKIQHR